MQDQTLSDRGQIQSFLVIKAFLRYSIHLLHGDHQGWYDDWQQCLLSSVISAPEGAFAP